MGVKKGKFTSSGTKYGNVPSRAAMAGASIGGSFREGVDEGYTFEAKKRAAMELAERKAELDFKNQQASDTAAFDRDIILKNMQSSAAMYTAAINNRSLGIDPTRLDLMQSREIGGLPSGVPIVPGTGNYIENAYKRSQTNLNVAKTETQDWKNSPPGRKWQSRLAYGKEPMNVIIANQQSQDTGFPGDEGYLSPSQIQNRNFEQGYVDIEEAQSNYEQKTISSEALRSVRELLSSFPKDFEFDKETKGKMLEELRKRFPDKQAYPAGLLFQALNKGIETRGSEVVDYFRGIK